MKTLADLIKERAAKIEAAQAVDKLAEQEKRELTEEEASKVDALLEEAKTLQAEIDKAKANDDRKKRLSDATASLSQPSNRTPGITQALSLAVPDDAGISTGDSRVDRDPLGGFDNLNEYFIAIKAAGRPGHPVDARLLTIEAAAGANTEYGEEGGFLVLPSVSNTFLEKAMAALPILAQCDKLTLTGNSVTVKGLSDHDRSGTTYRYGGIVVYYVGESDEITLSHLKFREVTLKLNKMAAMASVTEEEMSDVSNFGSRLTTKMGSAIADTLTRDLMFGNGVKKPLGAFNSNCCVSAAIETNQTADTIVFENVVKMMQRLYPEGYGKATWFCNQEGLIELATMYISAGSGGVPAWLPAGGISGLPYQTLMGRPLYLTDKCKALGDVGDFCLADFSQQLLAMKGGPQTAMSVHVRFIYDESLFRATFRVDGQPGWDRALTPENGTDTLSPFVKLAERA